MIGTPSEKSNEKSGAERSVTPAAKPGDGTSSPGRLSSGTKFRKASRLLKHADFDRVYRTGRRHFSQNMTVFWLRRETNSASESYSRTGAAHASGPRVGFTVGRVMGGAVIRNRIKRRLREAVRIHLPGFALAVDVVINPKKSALTAEFPKLKHEVGAAFTAIEQNRPSQKR